MHSYVQVVKARGAAMAAAAAVPPGGRGHGMLSIVGLGDDDITRLCAEARERLGSDTVCQLANFLFPQVRCALGHVYVNFVTETARVIAKPFVLFQWWMVHLFIHD